MHGVPSGKISLGSTGEHVLFMFILQHLLQVFSTVKQAKIS